VPRGRGRVAGACSALYWAWGRASTPSLAASRVLGVREEPHRPGPLRSPLIRGFVEEGPLRRDVCGLVAVAGALEQWARPPSLLALEQEGLGGEGLVVVRRQVGWVRPTRRGLGLVGLVVVELAVVGLRGGAGGLVCRARRGAFLWGTGRGERVGESLRGGLRLLPSTPVLPPTILHSLKEG